MKRLKLWVLPIFVSVGLFLVLRPTFAQIVEGQPLSLSDYLQTDNVDVGLDVDNGFSRIYYLYDNQKTYVSQEGINSKQPDTNGRYIVWVTEAGDAPGQVFLYDTVSGLTIQLTFSGTNGNPKVSKDGIVVWNGWITNVNNGEAGPPTQGFGEASWQVFLFDGTKITQLTSGDVSFDPQIDGDYVSYTRRDITETYRAVVYSISKKEAKEITTGVQAKHPQVKNGKILLSGGKQEFPLMVDDLFVLDLAPLAATESAQLVSEADILNELESTASGIMEVPVGTESGNLH